MEENESDAASGAEEDKLVAPEGLVYSDDEAYLFKVESEDEFQTSFPKDVSRKNIIPGGPPKPDVRGMTKAKAKIVLKAYARYGASPLNNALNPTIGLKNSFF